MTRRLPPAAGSAIALAVAAGAVYHGTLTKRTAENEVARPVLRVCADPNNLPFSNERREGLENRLADLLAADLGATVQYTWWAQRRGFVRNTLGAGACDVVMGVPSRYELVLTTQPYYRSSHVFVSRRERRLDLGSFDDPRLARLGCHAACTPIRRRWGGAGST